MWSDAVFPLQITLSLTAQICPQGSIRFIISNYSVTLILSRHKLWLVVLASLLSCGNRNSPGATQLLSVWQEQTRFLFNWNRKYANRWFSEAVQVITTTTTITVPKCFSTCHIKRSWDSATLWGFELCELKGLFLAWDESECSNGGCPQATRFCCAAVKTHCLQLQGSLWKSWGCVFYWYHASSW